MLINEFWDYVDKTGECWLWARARDEGGYGRLMVEGQDWLAHRAAYELTYGPIPEELCVLHRCDNPPCVKPDHLFLGSRADNIADMIAKGRKAPQAIGQDNPNSRLTIEQVIEIKKTPHYYLSGGLAVKYGVTSQTIRDIRRGRTWRHV